LLLHCSVILPWAPILPFCRGGFRGVANKFSIHPQLAPCVWTAALGVWRGPTRNEKARRQAGSFAQSSVGSLRLDAAGVDLARDAARALPAEVVEQDPGREDRVGHVGD